MLKLAGIFTDNMVIQQGEPVRVWGEGEPGKPVTLSFAGRIRKTKVGADGRWQIVLDPMAASSAPRQMLVFSGSKSAMLKNILVGEVWVCSGQSNMEWPVSLSKNADSEITAASYDEIRLFSLEKVTAEEPQAAIQAGPWAVCGPSTVPNFSAVAYFFGRELHRRLGVPVGLINASWGGTCAEAWTSEECMLSNPDLAEIVRSYRRDVPRFNEFMEEWKRKDTELAERTKDVENRGHPMGWADIPEPSGEWKEMDLPGTWQSRGVDYSGILWFRKVLELPSEWAGRDLILAIGATDKSDVTYFNNDKVGSVTMAERPDSWSLMRIYHVPGRLAKAGRNVVAVRVHSDRYAGGMTGPANAMKISCPTLPGTAPIPLAGVWRYAVEADYGLVQVPPMPLGPGNQNAPSALFNSMIFPLTPFAIRGAIWYQGESNAGNPGLYRKLFPAMIRDWRRHWKIGDFPFLFVQLANYMARRAEPSESAWAELRDAQAETLKVPETGMAVAIDIGDCDDIHPRNKQDVGLRLAFNALAKFYGRDDLSFSGPMPKSLKRNGSSVKISYEHCDGGLESGGTRLTGFAVAGADRIFFWADAQIDGGCVIVRSAKVAEPRFVRYAWADNPECSLRNGAGLPAVPFSREVE